MGSNVAVVPYGVKTFLVTGLDNVYKRALTEAFRARFDNVMVRSGLESVLLNFTQVPVDVTEVEVRELVSLGLTASDSPVSGKAFNIPVFYDGEDLVAVSSQLGFSEEAFIQWHSSIVWDVALVGFAPGFPYLVPRSLADGRKLQEIPRLSSPRTKVPQGSVAIAAGMAAIYPSAMPGGWSLVGRTDFVLFDQSLPQPSTLTELDTVKFEQVKDLVTV